MDPVKIYYHIMNITIHDNNKNGIINNINYNAESLFHALTSWLILFALLMLLGSITEFIVCSMSRNSKITDYSY